MKPVFIFGILKRWSN